MPPARRRQLSFVLSVIGVSALALGLVVYALRQNINLFYSPSQLISADVSAQRFIRLGGMVVEGSVKRREGLDIEFDVTDYSARVHVIYRGVLPDLFREGKGVVSAGHWDAGVFKARNVLAKHDENYMPREIQQAIAPHHSKGGEG